MREIKFRAWDGKQMQQLTLMGLEYRTDIYTMPCLYIHKNGDTQQPLLYLQDTQPMQYTGLKDKNGTEIYEGDIFQDGAVVEWFDNLVYDGSGALHSGFYCKKWAEFYTEGEIIDLSWHYGFNDKNLEVIGNIYENPELVK